MRNPDTENLVVLEGEWDLGRKDELGAALGALNKDEAATIDLRGVTYVDSTVLGVLVSLRSKFAELAITLRAPQPHVLRVLRIVSFDELFDIVEA